MRGGSRRLVSALLGGSLLAAAGAALAARVPEWLERAAAAPIPERDRTAAAVVLWSERAVTVDGGVAHVVLRRAVRIQTPEGRSRAVALIPYDRGSAHVTDLHAWVLRPGGAPRELGSDAVIDMAMINGDVYNEARVRSVVAGDMEPGGTFAWEARMDDQSALREIQWSFQDDLPTLCSRLTVDAPQGWRLQSAAFHHDPIPASSAGTATTWELRDLPGVPDEPLRLPLTSLVARIGVSILPPEPRTDAVAFEAWDSLAAWLSDLDASPSRPDPAVTARATAIAGTGSSMAERIRSLASFVQKMPYASIQMGTGRGGGYRPRPSGEVLARSYGDCKDKANLLSCMLRGIGVPSYLLVVYSDDRTYVRDEWPAALQFNHCIVAITAPTGLDGPIVTHPTLGRLLIFDPTSATTALGDLPVEEQGSLGLLVTREGNALVRLPLLPPEQNRLERTNDVTLAPDGSIRGALHERSWGWVGAEERSVYQSLAPAPYRERIQSWLAQSAPRAAVASLRANPMDSTNAFDLQVEYAAERYAQSMDRLLLLRPTFIERSEASLAADVPRVTPIAIEERAWRETTTVHLPPGLQVDEIPDSIHLDTPFGTYRWGVEREAASGELRVRRELAMHRMVLPADQFPAVREFWEKVRTAEQERVVLTRTP